MSKTLIGRTLLALGLAAGLAGSAIAAGPHSHDGHGGVVLELSLDKGQKWQTDEALRKGMSEMRALVAASLTPIHEARFTRVEFAELADRVQAEVEYVAANCKLPEEADLQLHVVLARIIEGIDMMKGEAEREQGAVAIVEALNAYGEHFDHPSWRPLGH
jgi:hypothetical protein